MSQTVGAVLQAYSSIADLSNAVDFGQSKLFESVRRHYHTTPGELMASSRVDRACQLLLETEIPVSDIALDVGFEALSTFYDHFGQATSMAPTAFRKLVHSKSFSIALPEGFQSKAVLAYFGRDAQSLNERTTENELWIGAHFSDGPALLHLAFEGGSIECDFVGCQAIEGHRAVVRMLGLRQDPNGFEQHATRLGHSRLFEGRAGLRMPLTASLYDAVVWSILGQQVNLNFAYTMRRRLSEKLGVQVAEGLFSPPQPSGVAGLEVEDLLPLQFSRRKAEYLIDFSRQIADGMAQKGGFGTLGSSNEGGRDPP